MQKLTPLLPTGLISRDRATINDNFDTLASNFSGDYFPTNNLFAGMRCWRTDQQRMYQLADNLVDWIIVDDMSQGYNSVAHANRADYATMDDTGKKISETYSKVEDESSVILRCYPVGSIYMSMISTSPAELFGGSWQQISGGRVLLGASSSYRAGTMGGNETHTIRAENIPAHTHTGTVTIADSGWHTHSGSANAAGEHSHGCLASSGDSGGGAFTDGDDKNHTLYTNAAGSHTHTLSINDSGTHSHGASVKIDSFGYDEPTVVSNMQPYLVVYMWQRIA